MCHFWAQNGPFVLNIFFFGTNRYYYLHLPISPFHCAKFTKFLQWIQSYEDAPFLRPIWSICLNFFFWKTVNIILIYLLATLIMQNFIKFFQRIQSYEDVQLLGPKWLISPNKCFLRKPVNEPCFFYSCRSTCQKSKSDINLLVKY